MTLEAATVTCPRCGASARMLPIVFGLPMDDLFSAEERGEIVIGGCIVTGEDPTHRCSQCGEDVILDDDPVLDCAACGRPLLGDPEDDPVGENSLPLCGECDRARNFDADLEAESLEESTLDGEEGW